MQTQFQRFVPAGATRLVAIGDLTEKDFDDVDVVIFANVPELKAIGYLANRKRHHFYHRFRDQAHMERFIVSWIDALRAARERREAKATARRERRAAGHTFRIGDVLHYSWGYEQTQPEFYQVVDTKHASVVIRRIAVESVRKCGDMSDYVRPLVNQFAADSELITKRVQYLDNGEQFLRMDHGIAVADDGNPGYRSWYG